jgi:hypothetical protein
MVGGRSADVSSGLPLLRIGTDDTSCQQRQQQGGGRRTPGHRFCDELLARAYA